MVEVTLSGGYDAARLAVTPVELVWAGNAVADCVAEILASLDSIMKTVKDLDLGWAGATAQEAQDFGDQWYAAMVNLFGSSGQAADGVMNMLVFALLSAGNNYNAAEDAIVQMFSGFGDLLAAGATSGGDSTGEIGPGDAVTDGAYSAVGESWPTPPPGG